MNCQTCQKEINLDSPSLTIIELPNAAKLAEKLDQIEKILDVSKVYYCCTSCQMTRSLNSLMSNISPFSIEIKKYAYILKVLLIFETQNPEFREKVRNIKFEDTFNGEG